MSRRLLPLLCMVVSGLAVAGCADSEGDSGGPAVAWVEKVCVSVEQGARTLASPPAADLADPQTAKTAFADYLGRVSQALDTVSAGIRDAGQPPVADGQRAVDNAMGTISEIKTAIDSARSRVADLPVTDPAGFQQALDDVGAGLAKINGVEGPTKDLKANPALNEAFGKAPACQRIDGAAE